MSLMSAYCLGLVMSGEVGHRSIPVETKIAVGMAYYRRADFKPGKICEVVNKKWSSEYITKLKRGDYEYPDSKKLLENMVLAQKIINFNIKRDYSKGATHFHDSSIQNPWGFKPVVRLKAYPNDLIFY
jgi:hypothetical protein